MDTYLARLEDHNAVPLMPLVKTTEEAIENSHEIITARGVYRAFEEIRTYVEGLIQ